MDDGDQHVRAIAQACSRHGVLRRLFPIAHAELWFRFGRTSKYPFEGEGLPIILWPGERYALIGYDRKPITEGALETVISELVARVSAMGR